MRRLLLAACFAVATSLAGQTTTRCLVNGQYVECQTSPNVVVLPQRPDPIVGFLESMKQHAAQRQAQANASRAEAAAAQRQASMMMAEQFARLPLDAQIANYDRLPADVKAYVLNPNLLVAPKPPERIARDSELGKFILQLMSKGVNTLDDLFKALEENPELVMPAATPALSPKLEEAVAREKENYARKQGADTPALEGAAGSVSGDGRCVFVTKVWATCDTCKADTEADIKKLREYLESLALAEAQKRGANEVEWVPFNPLRRIDGNAYKCRQN